MSENFRKIKKKYLTVAIVASCILGACLGVALACTLAVVLKTSGVNFHWAIYIPIALVLSAGAGFLFFLILRPEDRRIAKKLDRDFSLKQKVQTMVEFAGVESDMHTLQREQTDEVLGGVAQKRVDLKWLLKFAFVPVIALAMLFAGIFVPAKKTSDGYTEPVYNITNAQATALENLMAEVESSSLETGLNVFIRLELKGLLDMLKETEYESEMKSAVIGAVHNIDRLVADTDSYLKIDAVFAGYEVLKPFSVAVVNSVVDYKNYAGLTSMTRVKEREDSAVDRITSVLTDWKKSYMAEYSPKAEDEVEGTLLPAEEAALKLKIFADALENSLADVRLERFAPQSDGQPALLRAAEGDALYNAYSALAANLERHAQSVNGNDDASYNSNTDGYLTEFIKSGAVALATQSYNCMMDDYLRNRLSVIFGISRAEFGSNADVAPDPTDTGSSSNKGEKEEGGGGFGPGEHRYGSNDEILDPDSGEKKKYSDPVNPDNAEYTFYHKYYDRAMEYINNGQCSSEVAAYIRQYFAYLNNGMDNTNN